MQRSAALSLPLLLFMALSCSDSGGSSQDTPDSGGLADAFDAESPDMGDDMGQADAPDTADPSDRLEVTVAEGRLRGAEAEGVLSFKGVPYAAPPTGELRWRPPQPAAVWEGVRDATAFGPQCPTRDLLVPTSPATGDEDCLSLNVWTPSSAPESPLPVMVWLHGGAWFTGTASSGSYDGTLLALNGVVVVTLNYRLDTLGYLAHPALTGENGGSSGNWGYLDQQAALGWVRDNIAAFGGDPGRVTIFGESAGGHAVCAHMVASEGLFHAAISQSGLCSLRLEDLEDAHAHGDDLAEQVGCGEADDVLACLRALPVEALVAITDPKATPGSLLTNVLPFKPIVDGELLSEQPAAAFAAGRVAQIPFLTGTTADEANLFHADLLRTAVSDEAEYLAALRTRFGDDAEAIAAEYPAGDDADAALNRACTDGLFACPARRAARAMSAHPAGNAGVWLYLFDAEPAGVGLPGLGAFHGAELAFVFGTDFGAFGRVDDEQRPLSETIQRYWTRFAIAADPKGGDDVEWPPHDAETDLLLRLSSPPTAESGYLNDACDFWDGLR